MLSLSCWAAGVLWGSPCLCLLLPETHRLLILAVKCKCTFCVVVFLPSLFVWATLNPSWHPAEGTDLGFWLASSWKSKLQRMGCWQPPGPHPD
jgi:hypothetical protein